jgi:hypothetical protein
MSEPVAAILHWDADEDAALERYERAVTAWREKFSGQSAGPLHAIAGRSERGGLVVVNVFPTNEDHLAFGRNMGDLLAAVGLPTPDVEHVSVRRLGWPEIADGDDVDPPQLAESEPHDLARPATRARCRLVMHR